MLICPSNSGTRLFLPPLISLKCFLPKLYINNNTHVHRLLETKPDYFSLRVFRCACWPNLCPYNKRKLAFRSTWCVFLGYSTRHKEGNVLRCLKGVSIFLAMLRLTRLFFPSNHFILISGHVFDKKTFYSHQHFSILNKGINLLMTHT
jgi:hypothetical protein